MIHPFHRNVLPTEQQTLLLKACLLKDPASADLARRQWRERTDFDALDHGSFRLLPLLWKRSTSLGWDLGKDEGRIRGIYRYSWSKYQLLNRTASKIIQKLTDAGITVTVLKGTALSHLVYDDPVCRPCNDLDILVPDDKIREAVSLLESEQWTTLQTRLEAALQSLHAIGFRSPDRIELDLHRHVLESKATSALTGDMVTRRQAFKPFGPKTLTLGFEDHFIHTCAHGAVYSPWPQIRWLADTDRILRHCGSGFDWDLAISTAEAAECIKPFRETVSWLRHELEHPVPAAAIRRMDAIVPTVSDRLLFRVNSMKTPENSKFRHRLAPMVLHYHRQSPFRFSREWAGGLKRHLIAANNFNRSAKDLFRTWLHLILLKVRNIQFGYFPLWMSGIKNWSIHRDSISRRKESELFGFHLLECDSEKRLLRWSGPKAGLVLRDFGSDFVLRIQTLNCRPGLVHDTPVGFTVNGIELPDHAITMGEDGIISVQIKRPYRPETGDTWLTWKTAAWELAVNDPRELGIPVYSIRCEPSVPKPAMGGGCTDPHV